MSFVFYERYRYCWRFGSKSLLLLLLLEVRNVLQGWSLVARAIVFLPTVWCVGLSISLMSSETPRRCSKRTRTVKVNPTFTKLFEICDIHLGLDALFGDPPIHQPMRVRDEFHPF